MPPLRTNDNLGTSTPKRTRKSYSNDHKLRALKLYHEQFDKEDNDLGIKSALSDYHGTSLLLCMELTTAC